MKVIVRPFAEFDIIESHSWYSKIETILAKQFIKALDAAIQTISKNPMRHPVKFKKGKIEVRSILLKRFPFHILYHIQEESDTIFIEAVWHYSRADTRWKKRLNN